MKKPRTKKGDKSKKMSAKNVERKSIFSILQSGEIFKGIIVKVISDLVILVLK